MNVFYQVQMVVISNSTTQLRNLAYNVLFKRTSTSLIFVLGNSLIGRSALHRTSSIFKDRALIILV